jgi:hypothetical protein
MVSSPVQVGDIYTTLSGHWTIVTSLNPIMSLSDAPHSSNVYIGQNVDEEDFDMDSRACGSNIVLRVDKIRYWQEVIIKDIFTKKIS